MSIKENTILVTPECYDKSLVPLFHGEFSIEYHVLAKKENFLLAALAVSYLSRLRCYQRINLKTTAICSQLWSGLEVRVKAY